MTELFREVGGVSTPQSAISETELDNFICLFRT